MVCIILTKFPRVGSAGVTCLILLRIQPRSAARVNLWQRAAAVSLQNPVHPRAHPDDETSCSRIENQRQFQMEATDLFLSNRFEVSHC
jgi:hypothetical protein